MSARFKGRVARETGTAAVFSVSTDWASPSAEEVEFALRTWAHFPDRVVGYAPRTHYWDAAGHAWLFSSKMANDYTMVLLSDGAVYSSGYHGLITLESARAQAVADQIPGCAEILLNFVASRASNFRPPVALAQRRNMHSARCPIYGVG